MQATASAQIRVCMRVRMRIHVCVCVYVRMQHDYDSFYSAGMAKKLCQVAVAVLRPFVLQMWCSAHPYCSFS